MSGQIAEMRRSPKPVFFCQIFEERGLDEQHPEILWLRYDRVAMRLARLHQHRAAVEKLFGFPAITNGGRGPVDRTKDITFVEDMPRRRVDIAEEKLGLGQVSGAQILYPRRGPLLRYLSPKTALILRGSGQVCNSCERTKTLFMKQEHSIPGGSRVLI